MNKHINNFLSYLRDERQGSEHTVENYERDIFQFVRNSLKCQVDNANFAKADIYQARSFIVYLQQEGLAKTSILRKISSLRSFYRFLVREEVVEKNPFVGITSPKKGKKLPKYLSVNEVGALLDAPAIYWKDASDKGIAKDSESATFAAARDAALLEVIYSGGLRISEALGINFGDLDLGKGIIKVRGKGKKERIAALGTPAIKALRTYFDIRVVRSSNTTSGAPIFVNKFGNRLTPRSFQRFMKITSQLPNYLTI